MAMPRYMARLPYGNGKSNIKVDEFHFEEFELSEDGENQEMPNSKFCWSNAAYALAERVTESFFVWGWTTAIRGVENGGLVRELPLYKYTSARGDTGSLPNRIGSRLRTRIRSQQPRYVPTTVLSR